MARRREWTAAADAHLLGLRAARHEWRVVAARLGVSRSAVIERARALGLAPHRIERIVQVAAPANRPPLPAGHRLSWGAITDGTVLEGEAYPLPVAG